MKNGWVERAWRLLVISLCWYFYVHVSSLMSRVFKALFKLAAPSGKEAYSSQPELQKRQKICDSRVANHRCTQEPYCSALIQFFFFYAFKWSCCKLWVTTEQQKPCPCVFRVLAAAGGTFFKSSDQFVSFIWCPAQQLWKIYKKPACLMSDMMEVNETLAVTKLPNSEWMVIGWDLLILRQIPSS